MEVGREGGHVCSFICCDKIARGDALYCLPKEEFGGWGLG